MAFTASAVYGVFRLDVCGVHRVCSLYEAFELVVWWHLECLSRLWVIGVGPLWRLQRS